VSVREKGSIAQGETLLRAASLDVGRRTPVLRAVEWELREGQCWFLLGPNGAGKSTLLATLLGLLPPLRGTVELSEVVRARRALGFVPQQDGSALTLPITAREFVALGLCDLPISRREANARADEALAKMSMEQNAHRRIDEMSLGQRRRALVARALARRRHLLVLDDPTANLDPETAEQLAVDLDVLRCETGMCIVHASHDLWLAERFATHTARIAGDRLVLHEGAPKDGDIATPRRGGPS
jgi:zinc transport system ATP-binding protein